MTLTAETLAPLLPYAVAWCALLGLILGSFVQVVAHRVPAGLSVVKPRSACPHCQTQIRSWDNIPVLSWLALGGKCRDCKAPIPARYPIVEVTVGVLFAGLAAHFGFDWTLPVWLYLAAVGTALFLIDLDHKLLPSALVLPSYPVVVALLALDGAVTGTWPLLSALGAAGVWALIYGGTYFGSLLVLGKAGMGWGDVKLAPLLGLALGWLGWGPAVVGLGAGFALGGLVGVALLASGKARRGTAIPFGPFMLVGALLGALVGQPLWDAYLSFTGLTY